jgi:hypothetical protein
MNTKPIRSDLLDKNTFINGFKCLFSDAEDEKSPESPEFKDLQQSFPEVVFPQDMLEVASSQWLETFQNFTYIIENMPPDANLKLKEYFQVISFMDKLMQAREQAQTDKYQIISLISYLNGHSKTLKGKFIINLNDF